MNTLKINPISITISVNGDERKEKNITFIITLLHFKSNIYLYLCVVVTTEGPLLIFVYCTCKVGIIKKHISFKIIHFLLKVIIADKAREFKKVVFFTYL